MRSFDEVFSDYIEEDGSYKLDKMSKFGKDWDRFEVEEIPEDPTKVLVTVYPTYSEEWANVVPKETSWWETLRKYLDYRAMYYVKYLKGDYAGIDSSGFESFIEDLDTVEPPINEYRTSYNSIKAPETKKEARFEDAYEAINQMLEKLNQCNRYLQRFRSNVNRLYFDGKEEVLSKADDIDEVLSKMIDDNSFISVPDLIETWEDVMDGE